MKIILHLSVLVTSFFGTLAHAAVDDVFALVTKSPAFVEYVAKSGDHKCTSVQEILTSKPYGFPTLGESTFSLVVLACSIDPHDSGDPIGQKGLALVEGDGTKLLKVLSYTANYYPQPD